MKKVMIVLGLVLVGLSGCGKSGKNYTGKYVDKDNDRIVLEINEDSTWELRSHIGALNGGEWEISKDRIVLYEGSIGGITFMKGELKGNILIDRYGGKGSYLKQD